MKHKYSGKTRKKFITGEALESGDMGRVARNEEFLQMLRDLSTEKIDFATAHLLSQWDVFSGGDEVMNLPARTSKPRLTTRGGEGGQRTEREPN